MSDMPLARLQFDRYIVNRAEFRLSESYHEVAGPIQLDFELGHKVAVTEDRTGARVTLTCELFPNEDESSPFRLLVEVLGFFTVDANGSSEQDDHLITQNTAAILFPYVRAVVTSITAAANVPPVVLPTINIVEMLKENTNLSVEGVSSDSSN